MEEYGRKEQIQDALWMILIVPLGYVFVVLAMCL